MSGAPDFGKMIGPLPLGAWVAVVGGGLGFMIYTRKQADVAPSTPDTTQGTDVSGGSGVGGSGQYVDVTPPQQQQDQGDGKPQTNEAWGQLAITWLIAQGYPSSVSDSAIRKYLDQESGYSSQEFALVTLALRHLGPPPDTLPAPIFGKPPVPKPPVVNKPPRTPPHPPRRPPVKKPPVKKPPVKKPPAPKPPAHVRYYTVKPLDNLSKIATKYYHNSKEWSRIYNANKAGHKRADGTPGMISNPNVIRVGWKLIIP